MKIQTRAAIRTTLLLLGILLVCFLVQFIGTHVPGEVIMHSLIALMIIGLVYTAYEFILASLEHDQSMKRIHDAAVRAGDAAAITRDRRSADRKEFPPIQE